MSGASTQEAVRTGEDPALSTSNPEVTGAEERRSCPRSPSQLRVEAGGVHLATTNVSTSGMQLSCPALLFGLLQPHLERGTLEATLQLLPDVAVPVRCAVVYVAHYGYEYLLGARFVEFEGDGLALFGRHCLEGDTAEAPEEPDPQPQAVP